MTQRHKLKTWPRFFEPIARDELRFTARRNDREYEVGDVLTILEYDPVRRAMTGRSVEREVTFVMDGGAFGVDVMFCIVGFRPVGPYRDA